MTQDAFHQRVRGGNTAPAMPIATYPGLALTGGTVREVVTSAAKQCEIQAALQARYGLDFVLTAMDLSAEAEAFGCALHLSETEIPSVTGRKVTNLEQARALRVPEPGECRTSVYLEAVGLLARLPGDPLVMAGCVGPFSLAARIVGVSEALELTLAEPELMEMVLEKSTDFLARYVMAFKNAGAAGVIMAEPAAGLLSPRAMARFSSAYVRRISESLADNTFSLVLHNCAAKLLHLPAVLETGLRTFHFGAPMDLPAALAQVPEDVLLCGNLDPAGVFCQLSPEEVGRRTAALLSTGKARGNLVVSSGCDLPPGTPLASLDAFYAAARQEG